MKTGASADPFPRLEMKTLKNRRVPLKPLVQVGNGGNKGIVVDKRNGNRQQDAQDAEDVAHDDDGRQVQQAGYAQRIAKEPGFEDVAVEGLQENGEGHDHQSLPGD